jgi:hypothetical protein
MSESPRFKIVSPEELAQMPHEGNIYENTSEKSTRGDNEGGRSPESGEGETSLERAVEILGAENVDGPEIVKHTFDVDIENPSVPFSEQALERAAKLGQMLVLRANQDKDGRDLTPETMHEHLSEKWGREDKGKFLFDEDNAANRLGDTFNKETPEYGWALASKELTPDTTDKNYLEQTDTIAAYLQNEVFKDQEMPQEYQDAIKDFNSERPAIEQLMNQEKYDEATTKLTNLSITKLTRRSVSETLYDLALHYEHTGEHLLSDNLDWTRSVSPGGHPRHVGDFASGGVGVVRHRAGRRGPDLGLAFSRTR